MAQALFDDHPLEEYLREAGESQELMPGVSFAVIHELEAASPFTSTDDSSDDVDWEWRPHLLIQLLQCLEILLAAVQLSNATNPLVERFKYNVISSSLLSTDLSLPHSAQPTPQTLPGYLGHSRASSEVSQHPSSSTSHFPSEFHYTVLPLLVFPLAVLSSLGCNPSVISIVSIGLACIYYLKIYPQGHRLDFMPCLDALDELIAINNHWESVVQEALISVERDEHSPGSTLSITPSSTLRVALHSTFQTTQSQCDNIRHLLSALTSPSDLAQLSEMYAPPSPIKSPSSLPESPPRPFSFPLHLRPPTASPPSARTSFNENKRTTWNGSQKTSSGSQSAIRIRRRHRSDLSSLLQPARSACSAPVTPAPSSPKSKQEPLADVSQHASPDGVDSFGTAALRLQRRRTSNGLEMLESPPQMPLRSRRLRSTSSASRFTSFSPISHSTSHSLSLHHTLSPFPSSISLATLHHTLNGALGAKRYACAHLLALRFSEIQGTDCEAGATTDGDGGYWEDVRSVMGLLCGALGDAAARLSKALQECEAARFREGTPTPLLDVFSDERNVEDRMSGHARTNSGLFRELRDSVGNKQDGQPGRRRSEVMSFAPMPSRLAQFAGHVASVRGAMEDAREYLDECVEALKREERGFAGVRDIEEDGDHNVVADGEEKEHPALRAYEKLRRELGFALRECERGRSNLLDLVKPPSSSHLDSGEVEDERENGVQGNASSAYEEQQPRENAKADETTLELGSGEHPDEVVLSEDDASKNLPNSTDTVDFPPPHGVEQVFETDTSNLVDRPPRERSKLSREERIKLMKAKRESAAHGGDGLQSEPSSVPGGVHEKWGPGGEVVQELKDVIWKVGERRRKVRESGTDNTAPTPPTAECHPSSGSNSSSSSLPNSTSSSTSSSPSLSSPKRASRLPVMTTLTRTNKRLSSGSQSAPVPMRALLASLESKIPHRASIRETVLSSDE